ncbi:MAG TPA: formate dehydrogenase accessory sulfurtransferase FdhD [Planctomycetota bacterium]|nr:formate dehydrogenase accessory sulfurtransferase FdhD [Planctomycetota bacterium]
MVAVEEPLELRVGGAAVATLMRTPGSDRELALGFFFNEGWISSAGDVGSLVLCAGRGRGDHGRGLEENVVDLIPAAGARLESRAARPRAAISTSSCGVCGKRTIEDVLALTPFSTPSRGAGPPRFQSGKPPAPPPFRMERAGILRMPEALRKGQRLFESTGAIHAAGLFDASLRCEHIEEDVGRHNAVDKTIGWAFLEGKLPLSLRALQVSGRVSFEIVQKAFMAGIPLIAAVSGVSSLAVDLAEVCGITVVGFVRGESLTVYCHPERVLGL